MYMEIILSLTKKLSFLGIVTTLGLYYMKKRHTKLYIKLYYRLGKLITFIMQPYLVNVQHCRYEWLSKSGLTKMKKLPTKGVNDVRFVVMSDLHFRIVDFDIPFPKDPIDILLIAGDLFDKQNSKTQREQLNALDNYLGKGNIKKVIMIGGNHDKILENEGAKAISSLKHIHHYLENETIELYNGSLKIHGCPVSLRGSSDNNAFQVQSDDTQTLKKIYDKIPQDLDILLTHGPAKGIRDGGCGCKLLKERIEATKPVMHVFGHYHKGRGYQKVKNTHYLNVSNVGPLYIPTCPWLGFDYNLKTKTIV